MERVAELTLGQVNAATRPFRILLVYQSDDGRSPTFVVEYQDVFEYANVWRYGDLERLLGEGWEVVRQYTDADGDLAYAMRHVKLADQESE